MSAASEYLRLCNVKDSAEGPKNETLAEHREHCEAEEGNCPFEKEADRTDADVGSGSKRSSVTPDDDAAYMDVANRIAAAKREGRDADAKDIETARRMVREAAAKAMTNTKVVDDDGLPKIIYRGTVDKENVPRKSVEAGSGIFLTDNEDVAGQFTFEREYGELITSRYNEETDEYEDVEGGQIESCFVNVSNPKIIIGRSAQIATDDTSVQSKEIEKAFSEGYDCLRLENVKEGVDDPLFGTSYIVRKPSQIKSAYPVTYDDAGNVIPLSRRFNMDNPDIRY